MHIALIAYKLVCLAVLQQHDIRLHGAEHNVSGTN